MLKKMFKRSKPTPQCAIQNINNICDKTIVWGQAFMDIKTGRNADVNITNIHVDSMNDEVTIVREIGLDVKHIKLTMERARDIGFINLNALGNYC